ncbi:hypothetical protein Tco_1132051 [Tanacetum coccineum]|uniref:Uncharacterized protein n=1 Tax=Tanacetum coccineum TaxID=301880 RepID=A0ABQ5JC83_9ASTR
MDVGSVNVPYLLARYLRLFASGRKQGAMISSGPTRQEGDAGGVDEEASVAPRGGDEDEEMPQREVLDSLARDLSRFTTWTVTSLSQMMYRAGVTYTRYSESLDLAAKKSTKLVKYRSSGILCVIVVMLGRMCGSFLSKELCLICASRYGNNPNPNSLNDSPNISKNVSQSPLLIDHHCCYGCGDSLDGIFCQQCTCKSCGNGAHYGYNCRPKVPIISNPEPCNNQTIDELLQTLPSFDPTCYSGDGSSFTYDSTPNFIDDSHNVFNPPSQPPTYSYEFCGNDAHYGYDCLPQVSFIYNPEPFDQFEPPQHPVIHQPIQEKTCAELLAEERAANIDQSPPQEMSIQDMEDLKQQYLDEMKSLINEIQIKDYRNEKIDIQYRRECEIKIDELKQNFNRMSIEIRKKEKELLQQEQEAYVRTSQRFNFIDDDDDDEYSFAT